MNADRLFDAFPDLFFGSLKEQMFMGILPSETVEIILKPLLEEYDRIMPQLPDNLQDDIKDIFKIYPEIAEEYEIDKYKEFSGIQKLKDTLTEFVSSLLWIPEGAGLPATAADIPEQEHEFIADEFGEIKIICYWDRQNQDDEDSAYIRVSWDANLTTESGLCIRFINPETRQIYHEAPLGNIWTGEAVFESRILGFNPLKEKWGISIVISEAE